MKHADTVLVTGVSGDLGTRLVPLLCAAGYSVIGVDMKRPAEALDLFAFHQLDLGREQTCDELISVMRDMGVRHVVHLAFVLDGRKTGVVNSRRMYQINVAGSARVAEAVAEVNRKDGSIRQLLHMSSVAAYGPKLPLYADEEEPLRGRGLLYAEHKREADLAVQRWAGAMGSQCSVVILRPQIFAGPQVQNYMIDALRGTPSRFGKLGLKLREKGKRLPIVMGLSAKALQRMFQFVHVDDVARTVAFFVSDPEPKGTAEAYNLAGRGDALCVQRCAAVTGVKIVRLPGEAAVETVLKWAWRFGASDMPPDALPYVLGEYTLSTEKLQGRLGKSYPDVVRYTNEQALSAAMGRALEASA